MSTTLFSTILFLSSCHLQQSNILKNSYFYTQHPSTWHDEFFVFFFTAALKKPFLSIVLVETSDEHTSDFMSAVCGWISNDAKSKSQKWKRKRKKQERNKRLSIEKYDYCVKNDADKGYTHTPRCNDTSIYAKRSKVDLNVLMLVILE